MKIVVCLFLLSIIGACSNPLVEIESADLLTWEKMSDLPLDFTRIGSAVIVENDMAYVMPGKGSGRFSSVPEIMAYSDEVGWRMVGTYQGLATVGKSAFWQIDDKVMVVGGANASNAPFDQITMMSVDGSDFEVSQEVFPKGPNRANAYAQLANKGYISFTNQDDIQSPIELGLTSYHFETEEWIDIPLPNISSIGLLSTSNALYLFDEEYSEGNFYRYVEEDDSWMLLADFPGISRTGSTMLATDDAIYIGFGSDGSGVLKDIWKYDIVEDSWEEFIDYPGPAFHSGIGFAIGDNLYFGAGSPTVIIGEGGTSLNTNIYRIRLKE